MALMHKLITSSSRCFGVRSFSNVVEKKKMNLFTAVNDAMRIAMATDPTAIVFGEGIDKIKLQRNTIVMHLG